MAEKVYGHITQYDARHIVVSDFIRLLSSRYIVVEADKSSRMIDFVSHKTRQFYYARPTLKASHHTLKNDRSALEIVWPEILFL